jgi:hypothetical protein
MKKFFIILFVSIAVTVMGGCLNLEGILPFLNKPPVIISEPIITATEDKLYLYQVEASDPNGDTLTHSFIIKPEGMSIDSENGLIIWTPTNDQVRIHQVIIEISDGKYNVQQNFEIEVFNVNNPPKIFSYFPVNLNFEINEGDSVKFEVQAHDVDLNAVLSYQWLLNEKKVSSSTVLGNDSKNTWIYSIGYGDYSQKIVKILVNDGELEDYVQWNITINDITPPAQPTLDAVLSPTNVSPQTLSGTKKPNASIWINGVEVILVNSETVWSYNFELTEGGNSILITSKDTVGNESNEIYTAIILDTITPAIPNLESVSSSTNISSQILSGTKEANSSILINDTEVVSINSSTDWSHPYNLSEGTNNISITSRDAAGNESSAVTAIIILDTGAPKAPTLDTMLSMTNISPQTLSGTKETNTSIRINNLEEVPINPSTNWTYDFNLSEGENNISITSQDSAGNESDEATAKIILDTISPTVPALNEVITPTNISIQVLSGSKETDSSIWLNGTEVVPLDSSTEWSYSYNFSEETNNISITSCDSVGNESLSVSTTIVLDKDTPEIPTLDAVVSPTNISTQILSGNKETNSSIWINGTEVISINSDIAWSYTFDLFEGNNNISITSRDASGNESTVVTTDIVLDTIAPEIPTLNAVTSPTNISPQILSGTKDTNSSILINGAEIISVNSSVYWSCSYNLNEGNNDISITSRDASGNESSPVTAIIEYDPNIYVDAGNTSGIEDGTKTHPFNTITEGIDAVAPGKSVMVAAGTYNEQLIINKIINLQGAEKESTIISGLEYTGNLITIEADGVKISGFNIDGISATDIGIYSDSSSSIEISENIIQNHQDSGIFYHSAINDYSSGIYVYSNEICFNSKSGIKVTGEGSGIIESNTIRKNTNGIRTNNSASLEIKHNNINDNIGAGIICQDSSFLLIWGNEITINDYGIKVGVLSSDTTNPDIGGGTKNGVGQNKIAGNKFHGVSNKTAYNIMAKNNWWGNEDGPKYPGNTSSSGDWAYWSETDSEIIFTPHLTTEP